MIKLTGTSNNTFYVVDEKDIVGLNTWNYNNEHYYNVIVRWSHQWISVDAETYFRVKTILEGRVK